MLYRTKSPPQQPYFISYPGLVIRSIFYPGSSVGSTITFGIIEDTSSNPTSNISFKRSACACVYYKTCLPGSPGFGSKFGQARTTAYRDPSTDTSQRSRRSEGGKNVIRLTLGLAIDRSFTPVAQQVHRTITLSLQESKARFSLAQSDIRETTAVLEGTFDLCRTGTCLTRYIVGGQKNEK